MILLDTHVWVHWVSEDDRLARSHRDAIASAMQADADGVAISVISCWEVATLVSVGRLVLSMPVDEWVHAAVTRSGVRLQGLSPAVCVASTTLPGQFHRDPADRLLVATARALDCPILTSDEKIIGYAHVRSLGPRASQS